MFSNKGGMISCRKAKCVLFIQKCEPRQTDILGDLGITLECHCLNSDRSRPDHFLKEQVFLN